MTVGCADGLITFSVSEGSGAVLAKRQEELGELYRTMTGHVRHEVAHFLFLRLSQNPQFLNDFRALFGDEQTDYAAALDTHYNSPKPAGPHHITSYATAHPHEDWAETIAHLLHLVDLIDSAAAAQLSLPEGPAPGYDAYADPDTETVVSMAVDVSLAVKHANRARDLPEVYPFVLPDRVRAKHAVCPTHHAADRIDQPPSLQKKRRGRGKKEGGGTGGGRTAGRSRCGGMHAS